jgi:hypothetical protein
MSDNDETEQLREIFLKERNLAILRCAEIMVNSGRKDLAKQIISVTKISRSQSKK